jgi:hypothetical protein
MASLRLGNPYQSAKEKWKRLVSHQVGLLTCREPEGEGKDHRVSSETTSAATAT